ncbi:MAG TPA: DUF4384 domain-containing protein [Longimicrobium sp.]|jgi:hypothetical protein
MRTTFLTGLALIALGASAGVAAAQDAPGDELPGDALALQDGYQDRSSQDGYSQDGYYDRRDGRYQRLGVRVWLADQHDVFRAGEHSEVLVRTSADAYLAVIHIDPRGDVEFLWPRSYYDDGYVEGGRTLSVGNRGSRYLRLGGVYGIGYVFAVASDEPLDVERFRDYYQRRTVGFDRRLNVYGDPFYHMERIERILVRDWEYGYHSSDWYSYHVGRRYEYPRYACYSGYGSWYNDTGHYYGGCNQVLVLLRERPYYYDTRYYRGDRSRYYRRHYGYDVRRTQPEHGYKERTDAPRTYSGRSPNRRPFVESSAVPPLRTGSDDYQEGQEGRQQEGSRTRPRPTLQRRPPESEPARRPPSDTRREPPPATRESPPPRRDEPRAREAPPRSEPRVREAPPSRSEPRVREAPPQRSDPPPSRSGGEGTRSAPSDRSAPRVRPNTEG